MDLEKKTYADYERLIQILVNIIKNAVQFTEDGRIFLRETQGIGRRLLN
ncbi:hypothetical protein [Bacillus altitudinis]|nr:hypothetical protein [Bacillus altitudinis]